MTDEPIELVEPWIEANGVTHPVVILSDGQLERVIGVEYFPTGAVFYGKELQWKGSAGGTGAMLGEIQKKARKDSVYPKKLGKVVKSMNKGDQVKALVDLHKIMAKLDGRDAAWAGRLENFLLDSSAKAFQASAGAIEAGFWHQGVQLAQPYLGKKSPYPRVAETTMQLEDLKSKSLYSKEMSGGALYLKAQDLEQSREYSEAVKVYKSILKKSKDTQIAGHARLAAQKLIDEGRPGYKASCDPCRRNKGAACSKHREKVKL